MTLIVGIICKDAVLLAGESETTREVAKFQGTHKLHLVAFENGYVMIGEAGSAYPAGVCLDAFRRRAASTKITSEDTIPETLNLAFREYAKACIGPPIGSLESQDFHRSEINRFDFILGYFGDRPCLYNFSSTYGMACKCSRRFEMIGIGDELAEYILKEMPLEDFSSRAAANAAVYVVGEVKTSVSGCGGDTQITVVSSGNKPERLSRATIQDIELHLSGFLKEHKQKTAEGLQTMLRMAGMAYMPAPEDWWQPSSP